MSGVAVIRHLLANHAPLIAIVPDTRIVAGELDLNTTLPAVGVTQIVSDPQNLLRTNEANKLHTTVVQVTWLVKDAAATPAGTGYVGIAQLSPIVLAACPSQRGTVNGFAVDSIVPGPEGPDISYADIGVLARSRDFIVKWVGA